jgi:hypothetical protein
MDQTPSADHARVLLIGGPEVAIQDPSVVHPRNATRLVRQHRLNGGPFMVGEFVAHDSSPQFGSLNHGSPGKRNAPGPHLVRRLRTGADINQSSISAKCVENDPERKSRPPPSRAAGHLMFEQRKLPPISSAVSVPYCASTPRCSHGPGLRTAPLTLPAASLTKAIRV